MGTDHGYLGIYLLQSGKCARVIAADLREKPLASARANAAAFGIPIALSPGGSCPSAKPPKGMACASEHSAPALPAEPHRGSGAERACTGADEGESPNVQTAMTGSMEFVLSDGLHNIKPGAFDTLVLAGMGGDLIANILADAPWLDGGDYTLILQPQSAANDLRRWLGERGWAIARERLVRDGRFLYSVMLVHPGQGKALRPGEQYVSPALRREGDPLYGDYLARTRRALELTVRGITKSTDPADLARAAYYQAALEEVAAL